MEKAQNNILIYNSPDGRASVRLMTKDGNVWLNQKELALLFDTSIPNISMHIPKIQKDKELYSKAVIKDYLTTAEDGKLESAELRAKDRQDITTYFWRENVTKILKFQDKEILEGNGQISNAEMKEKVKRLYAGFNQKRKETEAQQADLDDIEELKALEAQIKKQP